MRFDEVNFPPVISNLIENENGLILVTGQTGSGKSTSLAAIIDYLNENFYKKIITLEDPLNFT